MSSAGVNVETSGTLIHCRWEGILAPSFWRANCQILIKSDPTLAPLPSNPTREIHQERCLPKSTTASAQPFTAALFAIVKSWKQPKCPPAGKWWCAGNCPQGSGWYCSPGEGTALTGHHRIQGQAWVERGLSTSWSGGERG